MSPSLPDSPPASGSGASRKYLSFTLGSDPFAVGIAEVREIIEYGQVTGVPMMPGHLRGVINLRGMVVPVIDLARRFGRPPVPVGRRTCIVILELARPGTDGPVLMGVIVDAVNAVLDIPAEQIEPPPEFGARVRTDFILGMGKVQQRFIILLDIARVLSVEELQALQGQHLEELTDVAA